MPNNVKVKPLLSICIPSLNRASLLEVLLENLEREASAYLDKVEIVVADNASVDNTENIVKSSSLPIVYGRQQETVGFAKNILFATTELATGEFVWILGDDDLVLPNAVNQILESISKAPDVDYHYLNFGWIDYRLRDRIINEENGQPPASMLKRLQCNNLSWKRLERLEDIVFLDGDNPSATFSGLFCFVTRRQFFTASIGTLQPSDSLDGSSTNIADCFPHAMISLPGVMGKPIAYIGEPCLMQGISGWEWGEYANKNMIFGTHQFFEWLEKTTFAPDAMQHLWNSYFQMAGKLFFRMLHFSDEHKGMDIVLDKAIPSSAGQTIFWQAFMEESHLNLNTEYDARNLSLWVSSELKQFPNARIGLWGVSGRGHNFVKLSPHLHKNLVWVADKDPSLHGVALDGTELYIDHPDSLKDANLDILVIGARRDFVGEIIKTSSLLMKPEAIIISVDGKFLA